MDPFRYLFNPGGLNNQKWALLGLFLAAHATGRPVILPDMCVLDHRRAASDRVAIGSVFDLPALRLFAAAQGVTILPGPPQPEAGGDAGGWEFFEIGTAYAGRLNQEGMFARETFAHGFFAALRPHVLESTGFARLIHAVGIEGVEAVVQLRIERDWQDHLRLNAATLPPPHIEPLALGYAGIMAKVATTLGRGPVLVVWDEDDLPESKEAIRADILAQHRIWMVSKTDMIPPAELARMNPLERSLIDFELARRARTFVGLTRSTFSNLVAFQAAPASRQFIYNAPGTDLVQRWDRGTCPDAASATNPLLARTPLVPAPDTARAGLKLTVVIAGFGELSNVDALCAGVAGAAISAFALHAVHPAALPVEYRALLPDGLWSDWVTPGRMVGAAGNEALLGLAVRGAGVTVAGLFAGGGVLAANGQDCVGVGGLAAMQVVVG